MAVHNLVAVEARLDYFVRKRKQDSVACRLVISPFAAEQSSVASELANAGAAALPVFEGPFVLVTIGVDQLARPVFNPFGDRAVVNLVSDLADFSKHFRDKGKPVSRQSDLNKLQLVYLLLKLLVLTCFDCSYVSR